MQKPMQDISLSRLGSLLELALRTSAANSDPYKDDLRCVFHRKCTVICDGWQVWPGTVQSHHRDVPHHEYFARL
jgi:hypothetical protein